NLKLPEVKVDSWGGYVFVNLDPDCEPLRDYLEPAASLLDPYEIERMRFRWRKWLIMPCNWKVALEAFNESYHTFGTHPQLLQYSDPDPWSAAMGKHGHHGMQTGIRGPGEGSRHFYAEPRKDYLAAMAESQWMMYETLNAFLSHSMVHAMQRVP